MGKLVFVLASAAGVGATGVGGFLLMRKNNGPKITFGERYKHALLSKTSDLWATKLLTLKKEAPTHPKLLESFNKAKETNQDETATNLLKEGCDLIYQEPVENSNYQKDFKNYCSKTNKEASSKTWNGENKNNNAWDTPLTNLKSHNVSEYGELNSKLATLKQEIGALTVTTYSDSVREKLKNWCEEIQSNIYEGPESDEFKQQERYCRKQ
ncbi:hypothetical protein MHC_02335 [Mycoplasma haemocanis str. Illinois]|uniref:Uncharacterized protein n=1 Tax=Mycoplasma haemocanis (strain Illinois) TaxID=1111676 RepID=H6N6R1_MYCHN|nr:hypothetical protein [Mycoplasma haemocanis]AEW45333.1 hypothetical protein MHC_02335 [Mycoplasma haemocanis str. Illinois]